MQNDDAAGAYCASDIFAVRAIILRNERIRSLQKEVYIDDGDMMSEHILSDDDYGGGPSGATGCLVFVAVVLGTLIASTLIACVWLGSGQK